MWPSAGRLARATPAIGLIILCRGLSTLGAQQLVSTLDVQGMRLRYSDTASASATGLSPALRVDWDRAMIRGSGTYARFAQAWSANGTLDGAVFTPVVGPFSAALEAALGGSTHQDGAHTGTAIGMGQLRLDKGPMGAWLGAGGGATSDGAASHRVREGEVGAWWVGGPASLTVIATRPSIDDSIRYTDFTADGSWRDGIFDVGASAGARSGSRLPILRSGAKSWGRIDVLAWLLPRVALLASAGTYPMDFTQSFPGGRFVSAGVRVSLSPRVRHPVLLLDDGLGLVSRGVSNLQLGPAGPGGRMLRLRAPNAHSVDLNGDFTGWSPRAMTPEPGGWFALTVPLPVGSYQLSIRVDGGEWMPPPSLPTVRDEFGGVAGVLVVR